MQNNQSVNNQQISMDKKYKTRSGLDVRILCTDAPGDLPVIGLVHGTVTSWKLNGAFLTGIENYMDLIEQKPYSDFKVDDPVMVRDSDGESWIPMYFSHVNEDGYPNAWINGRTSFTVPFDSAYFHWKQCRKPTVEELKGPKSQ